MAWTLGIISSQTMTIKYHKRAHNLAICHTHSCISWGAWLTRLVFGARFKYLLPTLRERSFLWTRRIALSKGKLNFVKNWKFFEHPNFFRKFLIFSKILNFFRKSPTENFEKIAWKQNSQKNFELSLFTAVQRCPVKVHDWERLRIAITHLLLFGVRAERPERRVRVRWGKARA